jgi:Fe-S-cluster-containing dehydrogenase component
MTRLAMAIDLSACVGCAACAIACKVENEVPLGNARLWIRNSTVGTFPQLAVEHRPEQCMHCDDPPCVPVCPTGCCFVRADGIVDIEVRKCIGCSACIAACPYDARYMDPKGYVSKCDFCKHRVAEGEVPACVETCPTLCRSFGDLDDPHSPVSIAIRNAGRVDVLRAGLGTRPSLYYLDTPAKFGLVGEEGGRS